MCVISTYDTHGLLNATHLGRHRSDNASSVSTIMKILNVFLWYWYKSERNYRELFPPPELFGDKIVLLLLGIIALRREETKYYKRPILMVYKITYHMLSHKIDYCVTWKVIGQQCTIYPIGRNVAS